MLVPPAPHLSGSAAARSRWRGRQLLGLLIVGAGLGLSLLQLWQGLAPTPAMHTALGAGGMAALATALGVLPMLCARAPGRRSHDALLGFGAGVMLAACCFSLLMPALWLRPAAWAMAAGPARSASARPCWRARR